MMLVASGLIVQMVFWMRRHGRTFKRDLEADMQSNAAAANWWGLLVVVALAVGRESAETVVFLYGLGAQYTSAWSFLQVLALGIGAAWLTFWVLQQGSRIFSWRTFFRVSEILLLLLAGALLVSAVDKLIALGRVAGARRSVWDTSAADRRFEPRRRPPRSVHRLSRAPRAAAPARCSPCTGWRSSRCCAELAGDAERRDRRERRGRRARPAGAVGARLAAFGEWLRRHARIVGACSGSIVAAYAFFVVVPASCRCPPDDARWFNSLAVFVAVAVLGRVVAVRHPVDVRRRARVVRPLLPRGHADRGREPRTARARAVPRWLKWGGWPFVAFALTTVFGQLVSVYQYPAATLLVLGGSTLAAIGVGLVYGRGKRVWCRHLCPVNGVFAVLSRVAPLHFRVDTRRVDRERPDAFACIRSTARRSCASAG